MLTLPPVWLFRSRLRPLFAGILIVAVLLAPAVRLRGESGDSKERADGTEEFGLYQRGTWEFGLESAYTFVNMTNLFVSLVKWDIRDPNQKNYDMVTLALSARYRLTNPSGPSVLRGSFSASATGLGSLLVNSPESYFAGLVVGLRYEFIQPRARLVPFVEMRGGPGVTDSRGGRLEQQQDLTFTYLLTAGLRYDVSRRWSVTLSALDQHLSGAGLADANFGVDSLGVNVGVLSRF